MKMKQATAAAAAGVPAQFHRVNQKLNLKMETILIRDLCTKTIFPTPLSKCVFIPVLTRLPSLEKIK